MNRLWVLIVVLFLVPAPGFLSRQKVKQNHLVLTHVTIIDATGAPAVPDMTIVITGDRITEIGKTDTVVIPEEAHVVDAAGKYLIPGLWDMHVHILRKERVEAYFPLLIANGITGVRDMGSPLEELENIKEWRIQIEAGTLLGPRLAAGPIVDGPEPMFPETSIAASNEVEGRRVVHSLRSQGADFVKVYSLLPRDTYFAIADEAQRQGIPFAGHVPDAISAVEASDAGQKSIEHLSGIRLACSSSEDQLRKGLILARAKSDPSLLYRALSQIATTGAQTYSNEKAEALFARFVKNATWQVPTLTVAWAVASIKMDRADNRRLQKGATAESLASTKAEGLKAFELVAAMRTAGVGFMAGTDAPNPWVVPGPSLHEELSLLVISGFTTMEALQAATYNPAKYLGVSDSLGTIEQGKIADLVLLDANPLDRISNTRRIAAVVIRGKLISKGELKALESKAEAASHKSSEIVKMTRAARRARPNRIHYHESHRHSSHGSCAPPETERCLYDN